ncbi:unnamed protein product [Amaranthus hypochondriacus]
MAYSMMSATNHKRKSTSYEHKNTCFKDSDWISLDLEDFISSSEEIDEEGSFVSSFQSYSIEYDGVSNFDLLYKTPKKVGFKKRKTMEPFVDQDLEDTASSPIQSPKVNDFDLFFAKSKEMDNKDVISKENRYNSQQVQDTNISLIESELRKKGLCLIPTSMLLNYLTANV